MPQHECETYDFPVKQGSFEFTRVSKRTADELRQTLKLAKQEAETKGTDAMRGETCMAPCSRDIYVETTIDSIELYEPESSALGPPIMRGFVSMVVGITWQAGILCFKPAKAAHEPKTHGGPGGE